MSDLKEIQEKVRDAYPTEVKERIFHLHLDAEGRITDSHWHASSTMTPAQRTFTDALEAFLQQREHETW